MPDKREAWPETREAWLKLAMEPLSRLIASRTAYQVPECYLSVGWPKGARGRGRTIGQCWPGYRSADGRPHVFISPELSDAGLVLATLLHELIHAAVEPKCVQGKAVGHKGEFIRACKAVDLAPPWIATTAGPELGGRLADMLVSLGAYPHSALSDPKREKSPGSRLRLWLCACGIKARVASDCFKATCGLCGQEFERQGSERSV